MYGNGNLDYKIWLLTADEITLATTYLGSNAAGWYWSLSPFGADIIYAKYGDNRMIGDFANVSYALRPAISFKSSVKISSGNVTASNPFCSSIDVLKTSIFCYNLFVVILCNILIIMKI